MMVRRSINEQPTDPRRGELADGRDVTGGGAALVRLLGRGLPLPGGRAQREVITFRTAGIRGPILRFTEDARTKRPRPPEIIALLVAAVALSVGLVYVATQNDTVYALSSATGRIVWHAPPSDCHAA